MFTGRVTEEELAHERPQYYNRLRAQGGIEALRIGSAGPFFEKFMPFIWIPPVAVGGIMLLLMILGTVL